MAITYHNAIEQLYVAYFNRPADAAGLAYWESVAQARQGDLASMSAAFAGSIEYRTTYAGMTSKAIVGTIYQNLFGRSPESAGVNYWADLLDTGKLTIDTIVKNVADGARLGDRAAFANKVTAATAFTAALDTPQEAAAYARPDAAPAARAFLNAITTDASLVAAIAPASLDAAIQNILLSHTTALTTGKDTIAQSLGHNVFTAPMIGGEASLQSGDTIAGGIKTFDTLRADMANNRVDAVTPILSDIDKVELRALATVPLLAARLDAASIANASHFVSDRSEADLVIQNVKLTNLYTSDVKVEMRDTATGDIDLGVYFEHASLTGVGTSTNILRLQLLDTRGMETRGVPLLDNFYDRVTFQFNGKLVTVQSALIDDALSYDDLLIAMTSAVAATPGLENVRVQKGASFTAFGPSGRLESGQEIVLYSVANDTFGTEEARFGTPGTVPPYEMHRSILTTTLPGSPRVASTIIVDGVGRGFQSGDLLVGSMLTGGFAEGVERFDIEVRNSSSLQTISSTNNALRDVVIRNGYASAEAAIGKGSLAVFGGKNDLPLPNATPGESGFTDVRTIDASAMQGSFSFTAAVTKTSLAKYDTPAGSDATNNFAYTGGAGNDRMQVTIDGDVLAATAKLGGNEAFMLIARGGAGDDRMTLSVTDGAAGWYASHAGHGNLMVDAGSGNDQLVVSGAANVIVDLGAGNDSYTTSGAGPGDSSVAGGAGDDRITLSTIVGTDAASSSNDTLVYGAGPFGNDVVFNFNPGNAAAGGDRIDFSLLGGRGSVFAGSSISIADNSITVQLQSAANDTAAEVAALFTDSISARKHVFVAVDSTNVGRIYTVDDTTAAAPSATLVGSIDLSSTLWGTLTGANFV